MLQDRVFDRWIIGLSEEVGPLEVVEELPNMGGAIGHL